MSTRGIILTWFLCLTLVNIPISHGLTLITNTPSFGSSETGPSISWYPDPNVTLAIDGAYTGQSQEIYVRRVWVNDSLGVDSVIFRFKWSYDEEWRNRTTVLVEGNETIGRYKGNLTWPAPGGGRFQFKVFANNTSGYWYETSPMTVYFGYLYFPIYYIPQFWLIVTCVVFVPSLTLVTVRRLKHMVSWDSRGFRQLQDGERGLLVKLVLAGFMAFVVLLSIGYTLLQTALSMTIEFGHGILGLSGGLMATVVLSYILIQVLKM